MSESEIQELIETMLRRELTPAEEARWRHVQSDPATPVAALEQARLSRLVRRLPPAELSTNFTSQVVLRVEALEAARQHTTLPHWSGWRRLLASAHGWQVACAAFVMLFGLAVHQSYQSHARLAVARSVVAVSPLASTPPLHVLEDFNSIYTLSQAPVAEDDKLVAALE